MCFYFPQWSTMFLLMMFCICVSWWHIAKLGHHPSGQPTQFGLPRHYGYGGLAKCLSRWQKHQLEWKVKTQALIYLCLFEDVTNHLEEPELKTLWLCSHSMAQRGLWTGCAITRIFDMQYTTVHGSMVGLFESLVQLRIGAAWVCLFHFCHTIGSTALLSMLVGFVLCCDTCYCKLGLFCAVTQLRTYEQPPKTLAMDTLWWEEGRLN